MNSKIRSKLVLAFVSIVVVSLVSLGLLSYMKTEDLVYKGYLDSNYELVKQVEYGVDNYLNNYVTGAQLLAAMDSAQSILSPNTSRQEVLDNLKSFMDQQSDVLSAYIGSEKSEMIDPTWLDVPDTYDPTTRDWYIQAKEEGKTIWTEPYIDAETGEVVVTVASPIFNDSSKLIGVVGIDIELITLTGKLGDIKIGQSGYPVLVSDNLEILTHKNPEMVGTKVAVPELIEVMENQDTGNIVYKYEGADKFASFKRLDVINWMVLVTMDEGEIDVMTRPIMTSMIVLVVLFSLIASGVASYISRRFVKPLIELEKTMTLVKDGDLTIRAEVMTKDELGRMAMSFNVMIEHFAEMLSQSKMVASQVVTSSEDLARSAEEVSVSSDEVARSIEEIAEGSGEQAQETEKGASLIGSLAEKIQVLTENGHVMTVAAVDVSNSNEKGIQVMLDLKEKTEENTASTERIERAIKELETKSAQIGTILETITSIADQTNLLALNASIEAARAGEHGRGFAVVADEIRKLAEGSGEAAENIRKIVSEIQNESRNTVEIMSEVKVRTTDQSTAVVAVEAVFSQINKATDEIGKLIREVTSFVNGMNDDKDSIISSIEVISAVSEEAAAASEEVTASVQQQTSSIEQVAKSAEVLKDMANTLQNQINKFEI